MDKRYNLLGSHDNLLDYVIAPSYKVAYDSFRKNHNGAGFRIHWSIDGREHSKSVTFRYK